MRFLRKHICNLVVLLSFLTLLSPALAGPTVAERLAAFRLYLIQEEGFNPENPREFYLDDASFEKFQSFLVEDLSEIPADLRAFVEILYLDGNYNGYADQLMELVAKSPNNFEMKKFAILEWATYGGDDDDERVIADAQKAHDEMLAAYINDKEASDGKGRPKLNVMLGQLYGRGHKVKAAGVPSLISQLAEAPTARAHIDQGFRSGKSGLSKLARLMYYPYTESQRKRIYDFAKANLKEVAQLRDQSYEYEPTPSERKLGAEVLEIITNITSRAIYSRAYDAVSALNVGVEWITPADVAMLSHMLATPQFPSRLDLATMFLFMPDLATSPVMEPLLKQVGADSFFTPAIWKGLTMDPDLLSRSPVLMAIAEQLLDFSSQAEVSDAEKSALVKILRNSAGKQLPIFIMRYINKRFDKLPKDLKVFFFSRRQSHEIGNDSTSPLETKQALYEIYMKALHGETEVALAAFRGLNSECSIACLNRDDYEKTLIELMKASNLRQSNLAVLFASRASLNLQTHLPAVAAFLGLTDAQQDEMRQFDNVAYFSARHSEDKALARVIDDPQTDLLRGGYSRCMAALRKRK